MSLINLCHSSPNTNSHCQSLSDVAPVNAFPRLSSTNSSTSSSWAYEIAAHDWLPWIGKTASKSVLENSGSYTVLHPGTNLRIISINTNYWYKQNFWLYDSDEPVWDPNGLLTWLERELRGCEKRGERAWISECNTRSLSATILIVVVLDRVSRTYAIW